MRQGCHCLIIGLILSSFIGCATPCIHEFYRPVPVETESVRITLREVQRGKFGGVATLEIVNLSEDLLFAAHGAKAEIRRDDGSVSPSVDQRTFEDLISRHGPIAMGLETWSKADPSVLLDPLGSRLNLKKDEAALVYVAFEEPLSTRRLALDLAPAISWRTPTESIVQAGGPIILAIDLPSVPTTKMPTKDDWRNVHFNVAVSSDDVIR